MWSLYLLCIIFNSFLFLFICSFIVGCTESFTKVKQKEIQVTLWKKKLNNVKEQNISHKHEG